MSDKPHVVSEICYRELAEKCDRLHDENEWMRGEVRSEAKVFGGSFIEKWVRT